MESAKLQALRVESQELNERQHELQRRRALLNVEEELLTEARATLYHEIGELMLVEYERH